MFYISLVSLDSSCHGAPHSELNAASLDQQGSAYALYGLVYKGRIEEGKNGLAFSNYTRITNQGKIHSDDSGSSKVPWNRP